MKEFNLTLGVVEGLKVKPFEVVSQDLNGNQLNIQLVHDSSMQPYDLTGATSVILYFLREDGARYQEYATITNHTQGRIEIVLETDVFAVKGKTLAEVAVYNGEEKKCTSQIFGFFVRKNLNDGEVFVSGNDLPNYKAEMTRLETILENLIITAGDSNPEIVAARYSIADGIDFPTLGDRLDHIDAKIENIEVDLTPIENEIADLAGPGRTTETVKQNADDIAQVADDLAAHQAESATRSNLGHVNLPEGWKTVTLLNGWSVGEPVGYFKDAFGNVRCRGVMSGGTITNGTVIFNLPAGYRPVNPVRVNIVNHVASIDDIYNSFASIGSNGDVKIYGVKTNIVLDVSGITFSTN